MKDGDTIAAISTPPGKGGIGIIRISGDIALPAALRIFRNNRIDSVEDFKPRYAYFGNVVDPVSEEIIDQAILTLFKAPASYTGEDVIEISSHGSKPILNRILEIITANKVRIASPGEFSYRAVANGKLDLTQAEAINEIICADTLLQAETAMRKLSGNVRELVESTSERLIDLVARLEAEVDFAEEGESFATREYIETSLQSLESHFLQIVHRFDSARLLKEGATVVLAGKTNAGKSTLFNTLLQSDRSIVDASPGTTRDYISEKIELDGVTINLVDTAGLRSEAGTIEKSGIARTEKLLQEADLVLLVHDASEKEQITIKQKDNIINIYNKMDIAGHRKNEINVSAINNDGIDMVNNAIVERLGINRYSNEKILITEKRQQELFAYVTKHLIDAHKYFKDQQYDELVLEELNLAIRSLREITGRGTVEDILKTIFGKFCIGK